MSRYPERVYLNGTILPAAEARVSVFDRGFVLADGVYEVMPVYGGRPFRLGQHLRRLAASLAAVRIANPHADPEWEAIVAHLIHDAGGGDLYVYLQITRGAAPRDHLIPADAIPTVFAYAQPIVPDPERIANGIAATLVEDMRWRRCDVKAIGLLANVLARDEATRAGSAEALFVRDGFVPEGASSNVFIVIAGQIRTPPNGPTLLPGVTRDVVLALARSLGLAAREMPITETELMNADEVWITSSVREIVAVVRVNGRPIGGGRPGPVYARLAAEFQDYKRRFAAGLAE
jgi:D-alanine transaminase